ncbi:hypothetical protein ACFWPK_25585 [Nocardia sp. NPDC058519]|uniref:hypothetical protein n=1 Tax=unclassified Nocardia TaxID=2637762 RepID=UPI00365335CD
MVLRPVAMYREMYQDRFQDLPSLSTAETGAVEPDRGRILEYMSNVRAIFDVMEATLDLVAGDGWIEGGSSLYSDGVWIWREDSLRYLAASPLVLPSEFVARVRGLDYTPGTFDTREPEFNAAFMSYF